MCLTDVVISYTIPFFYVPTYAETQLQSTSLVGSILSAIMDLGLAIGRIFLGIAADSGIGTMNTVIAGMMLSAISHFILWIPSAHSLPLLYVFSFLYGVLGGGYIG
jgi:MFS transporter, MCT family, aspergillic acid transporter